MGLFKPLFNFKQSDQARRAAVVQQWNKNPHRLLNYLNMQSDRCGLGVLCPYCGSGSGLNGTGMSYYTSEKGELRLKCWACSVNCSPIELILHSLRLDKSPNHEAYERALSSMEELYAAENSKFDDEIPYNHDPFKHNAMFNDKPKLHPNNDLINTYQNAVKYREACPGWQQKVADQLGVPFSALNRPDLGKTYLTHSFGIKRKDGEDPSCGDLAMFNLCNGIPRAVKVRKVEHDDEDPLKPIYEMSMLDTETNEFCWRYIRGYAGKHVFRMAGPSGELCFGHDTVTEDIAKVIIVEGQSDVLATCAALSECELSDQVTCIGRDSSSHILKEEDLLPLSGKEVIYVEDNDTQDNIFNRNNINLLLEQGCKVSCWTAPEAFKDPRAFYMKHGGAALIHEITSAKPIKNETLHYER